MRSLNSRLQVRTAGDDFAGYVLGSDFGFTINGYVTAVFGQPVEKWSISTVEPYRKCYGIDPEEFKSYRDAADSAVLVAWLDDRAVGHVVVSTNWNGYGHVDELAVTAAARRSGVARALLDAACRWGRDKRLPGLMLETQNNNLGACRLYEGYGFELGGIDYLRYRGIDLDTREVALFWYFMF
ncbi:N-acetyltransferase [Pseudomonas sp. R5(2019)]|uniref:GNAT family N-acetyltransferase n=1 Tax=Pseudomonas sp. R5(2019) TaxID=2697566 RepID=UPI001412093A|nr:GNAT family N-acetyltransferase [Pseudomonas sp. R5(2019)]NBA95950.1 GNAT family N-acetyltransferase [Pseudomonas sp. R5(2019)]